MSKVLTLKLISSILLVTLVLSIFSVVALYSVHSQPTLYPTRDVSGKVYIEYRHQRRMGVAWAKVHFINDEGEEFTAYSNWKGSYRLDLEPGNYTAYANLAWYSCNQTEVYVNENMRHAQFNFFIIFS